MIYVDHVYVVLCAYLRGKVASLLEQEKELWIHLMKTRATELEARDPVRPLAS